MRRVRRDSGILRSSRVGHRGPWGRKEKIPGGSAQAFEKARFRHGNPRKSKAFPLIVLAPAWLDFARFCSIWIWLGIERNDNGGNPGSGNGGGGVGAHGHGQD